jgi:putative transposase
VRRTVPPSAEIEGRIERLLAVGVGENPRESLSELAKLGARLIIQRAVEDEFDAWLGRARYERRPAYQRGLRNSDSGLRNGFRPRKPETLGGELEVEMPQVREAADPFVWKLFPCSARVLRTEPLRAMVIGAFVRGLSMRDIWVAVRGGRAGEAVEDDRLAHLRGAARALRAAGAPRPLRRPAGGAVPQTRSSYRSGPTGPRRACLSPGA